MENLKEIYYNASTWTEYFYLVLLIFSSIFITKNLEIWNINFLDVVYCSNEDGGTAASGARCTAPQAPHTNDNNLPSLPSGNYYHPMSNRDYPHLLKLHEEQNNENLFRYLNFLSNQPNLNSASCARCTAPQAPIELKISLHDNRTITIGETELSGLRSNDIIKIRDSNFNIKGYLTSDAEKTIRFFHSIKDLDGNKVLLNENFYTHISKADFLKNYNQV
jgi:hypothetical protein